MKHQRAEPNVEEFGHYQSQLMKKATSNKYDYSYTRRQPSYGSPGKPSKATLHDPPEYGRIKRTISSRPASNLDTYDFSNVNTEGYGKEKLQIDTSEIDRKINEIRRKYQEYSAEPIGYGKYNVSEPKDYSRETLDRAEDIKKRSFNYLKQYEGNGFSR